MKIRKAVAIFLSTMVVTWIAADRVEDIGRQREYEAERKKLDACVTSYLEKTYGGAYKVIESSYDYSDPGCCNRGGCVYDGLLTDENGKLYTVRYDDGFFLNDGTVVDIEIKEVAEPAE